MTCQSTTVLILPLCNSTQIFPCLGSFVWYNLLSITHKLMERHWHFPVKCITTVQSIIHRFFNSENNLLRLRKPQTLIFLPPNVIVWMKYLILPKMIWFECCDFSFWCPFFPRKVNSQTNISQFRRYVEIFKCVLSRDVILSTSWYRDSQNVSIFSWSHDDMKP